MSAWENYRLEWSPDPLSVAIPAWQDITGYGLARGGGSPIRITGGVPTMGSAAQPTQMTVELDNSDHRFTFGNTASPLSPNWKPGRRIRCYETIAGKRVDLFTGYIQPPDINDWAEQGVDQSVVVTAVDRLGRLGTGRALHSVLTEHILYNSNGALVRYWPCTDVSTTFADISGVGLIPLRQVGVSANGVVVASGAPAVVPQGGGVVLADDVAVASLQAGIGFSGGNNLVVQTPDVEGQLFSAPNTIAAGQVATLVLWLRENLPAAPVSMTATPLQLQTVSNFFSCSLDTAGNLTVSCGGAFSGSITCGPFPSSGWVSLAIRYGWSPQVFEAWVGGNRYTGSFTGSPPVSDFVTATYCPELFQGSFGHMQLYVGAASAWDFTAMQAQAAMAATALANQSTGQRITTLARYAGIPTTDLGYVDPGVALMQKAALAGKTPLTAMREAETTEQGRLRTNGQGLLVFDPRTRRYNS